MISKKSRKVVAALLIGATVCASGTFAYFNSKLDMSKIAGQDAKTNKKLAITNGHVEITGKINGTTGTALNSLWSYDVARVSTVDTLKAAGAAGAANLPTYKSALGVTDTTAITAAKTQSENLTALKDDADYILKHRSPDISVVNEENLTIDKLGPETVTEINGITQRAKIGSQVVGPVAYARPGDAFVFGNGSGDEAGVENAGLTVVNKSNITTKLGIRINGTKLADIKSQVQSMNAAGWKVYVKIAGLNADTNVSQDDTFANYTELNFADLTDGEIFELIPLGPGTPLNPANVPGNTGKDTSINIQLRVELPLLTGNNKQDLNTDAANGGVGTLDILDLFEIVATQENNPGWTQAGQTVTTSDAFTDDTGTDVKTDVATPIVP